MTSPTSAGPRLAVIPLANLSGDPRDEFFSDGLTEELISLLSRVRGVRVIARTSAMRFKGRSVAIAEIAKALDVAAILEGSVRRDGRRIRVFDPGDAESKEFWVRARSETPELIDRFVRLELTIPAAP